VFSDKLCLFVVQICHGASGTRGRRTLMAPSVRGGAHARGPGRKPLVPVGPSG